MNSTEQHLDPKQVEKELKHLADVFNRRFIVFKKIANRLGYTPGELSKKILYTFFDCLFEEELTKEAQRGGGRGGGGRGRGGGAAGGGTGGRGDGAGGAGQAALPFGLGAVAGAAAQVPGQIADAGTAYISFLKFLFFLSLVVPIVPSIWAGKLFAETTSDDPDITDKLMGHMIQANELEQLVAELDFKKKKEKTQIKPQPFTSGTRTVLL